MEICKEDAVHLGQFANNPTRGQSTRGLINSRSRTSHLVDSEIF